MCRTLFWDHLIARDTVACVSNATWMFPVAPTEYMNTRDICRRKKMAKTELSLLAVVTTKIHAVAHTYILTHIHKIQSARACAYRHRPVVRCTLKTQHSVSTFKTQTYVSVIFVPMMCQECISLLIVLSMK